MNTHRQLKISKIIEQRRPLANSIERSEKSLRTLLDKLEQLEACQQYLLPKVEGEILGKLQTINVRSIINSIESEFGNLSKLKTRFLRNTLNIGVIGRAGQGKSRLLQSLSGLSAVEIPTGDRSHCTGVQSTICHSSNVETYGEVLFYSEREFLDAVISPYYQKLSLGVKPFSLDEFKRKPLPTLSEELSRKAVEGAMYKHLHKYHEHFDEYRPFIGHITPKRINRQEIREYVAQDNQSGEQVYFKYLAVKEAKIFCSFPNSDVGQVALIDMPGLGDTGLGDDERLIKILSQDVDLVLFIRLPRPPREFWSDVDVELYDIAKSALTEIPLEKWSFLVLNRSLPESPIGDNGIYCRDLANSRHDKNIRVADCITANCANSDDANSQVLDRVLEYLTKHIQGLDQEYSQLQQDRILQIHERVNIELEKARSVLGSVTPKSDWYSLFISLFDKLWQEDLTTGLERRLQELSNLRNMPNEDFQREVNKVIQSCEEDPGIPSEEEIEKRGYAEGGLGAAYDKLLNEVRSHFSKQFLMLDEGLQESLERVKTEVTEVLICSGLGRLSQSRGSIFLAEIAAMIPDEMLNQPSEIKYGFNILVSFNLHYRGLIQHRIRQHLDDLTPNKTTLRLSPNPSASDVEECLRSLQAEAIYKCDAVLNDLLAEPNQAAFAIVEEFVDRVLRAKSAKNEWRVFLEGVRSEVWPEEFEALGEQTQMRRKWLDSVQKVTEANELSQLKLLN
ncbi:hypothetical protein PN441_03935 [Spirulina major CS-329]|uniref:hypothetical protein n=1 Tax=Spirulina TaxID=1154 RepID=UPI00232C1C51|nr:MULTISPECIES: hypothetical protein [Spirulina]MDB9493664.1 hypothetical protein [Spirulina subsalsa CS-330]MDB9502209.1 hypothetical protein [Spirulina major CS-329]